MTKVTSAMVVAGSVLIGVGVFGAVRATPARVRAAPPQASGGASFAITNVRVFDGEKAHPRATVIVRDGLVASVAEGATPPAGVETIDGAGQTLLPGLIDSHTHSWGNALDRALLFGVTTSLDMFTEHNSAAALRAEQKKPGGAPRRADLFSAGTLVTAAGGHGT